MSEEYHAPYSSADLADYAAMAIGDPDDVVGIPDHSEWPGWTDEVWAELGPDEDRIDSLRLRELDALAESRGVTDPDIYPAGAWT